MNQQSTLFTRYIPLTLIMGSLFLFVLTLNALKENRTIGSTSIPSNVISVSGTGEAFVVPDIATFSFGASATGKNVADAQAQVTTIINQALAKVKALGVAEKDIQTSDYSANPKYEYTSGVCTSGGVCKPSTQTLVGYEVNETITIKVRKVEDAGTILGAVGGTGVTNVSGLSFAVDNRDAVERQAREKAITDAKTKANALAKDLGVSLVRIVSFNENGGGMPIMYQAKDMMSVSAGSAPAPSVPVGENKIQSNVTITYEIR